MNDIETLRGIIKAQKKASSLNLTISIFDDSFVLEHSLLESYCLNCETINDVEKFLDGYQLGYKRGYDSAQPITNP